jgi:hypothetical protein
LYLNTADKQLPKPTVRLKLKLVVKGKEVGTAQQLQDQNDQGEGESGVFGEAEGERKLEEKSEILKSGTICVSTLVREHDITAMPSLEAPLTRKRRRGSGVDVVDAEGGRVGTRSKRKERGNGGGEKKDRKKGPLVNADSSTSASHPVQKLTNGTTSPPKTSSKPNDKRNGIRKKESKDTKSVREKGKEDREKALERNIDNVVFGDVTFKAWYPSWYPKEIIGEKALSCTGDGKGPGITVGELYVCRRCFGYSKVLVEWVRHCRCCEREIPGQRIYTYGGGQMWSVWEVDGGVETVSLKFSLLYIWAG